MTFTGSIQLPMDVIPDILICIHDLYRISPIAHGRNLWFRLFHPQERFHKAPSEKALSFLNPIKTINGNIIQCYLRIIKMVLLLFLFYGNHWLPFPLFSFTIIVFLCFRNIIEEVAEFFIIEDDPQFVKTMFSDSIDIGESS